MIYLFEIVISVYFPLESYPSLFTAPSWVLTAYIRPVGVETPS